MADPVDAFSRLLGRQASEREKARLYEVRDALNLHDNDALWLVLIALEHYETLYRQIPMAISVSAAQAVAHAVEAASKRTPREAPARRTCEMVGRLAPWIIIATAFGFIAGFLAAGGRAF